MKLTAETTVINDGKLNTSINTAQTTADNAQNTAEESAKTATSYITYVDANNGIRVHNKDDVTDFVEVNSTKIAMYRNNTEKMQLTDSLLRLGDTSNYAQIDASGMEVYKGGNSVAFYGDTARIGKDASPHVSVDANGFHIWKATQNTSSNEVASFSDSKIELGKSNVEAEITLCGGMGTITTDETYGLQIVGSGELTLSGASTAVSSTFMMFDGDDIYLAAQEEGLEGSSIWITSNSSEDGDVIYADCKYLQMAGRSGEASTFWLIDTVPPQGSQTYNAIWHVSSNSNYGLYRPSSSSIRYKEDVKPVEDDRLDPHRLYDIEVVQFKFKEGTFEQDDPYEQNRVDVIGFIAEDVYEHYPQAAIMLHDEVENWDERYIIPPMLKLIQEQNDRITELERRLS